MLLLLSQLTECFLPWRVTLTHEELGSESQRTTTPPHLSDMPFPTAVVQNAELSNRHFGELSALSVAHDGTTKATEVAPSR